MISHSAALALPLILAEWLSTGPHARVICDENQKILWHNWNFKVLLNCGNTVKPDREAFMLTGSREQSALSEFMGKTSPQDTVIWTNDPNGVSKSVLQCQRIDTPIFASAFGIRIADGAISLAEEFRHFESYFNFTKQEAKICRLMLGGRTVQVIVDLEGKSSDTVRFHIRNIYVKVGVSSREALFANLQHFMFS